VEVPTVNADKDHEQSSVASLLLRDGYRFPWTEAMARSRWKPWLWWLLQVLRVVLVMIVLVLIGWGIKALVNRQEAMEAAEIIALTAVLVTGAGAAFTVAANAWLGRKRLASEERMHTERLANERRLVHEGKAAEAYLAAEEVQRWIKWKDIENAARLGHERLTHAHKDKIMAAVDAITKAKAYAWTDEMATAAGGVIVGIAKLENKAYGSINRLREMMQGGDQVSPENLQKRENMEEQFDAVWWAYDKAIDDFRKAMNG